MPTVELQDKIVDELQIHKNAKGLFGKDMAKRKRNKNAPGNF